MTPILLKTRYLIIIPILDLALAAASFFVFGCRFDRTAI